MQPPMLAVADLSDLPRFNPDHRHPLWWGILGLIVIESMVVGSMIASYLYLGLSDPQWPPPRARELPLLWPSVDLALLLLSAVAMYWSTRAVNANRRWQTVAALTLAIALDALVLVFRWQQFEAFGFRWDDHAYGSIVWTMTGFHFMHVASAVVGTALVWLLAVVGYWTPQRQIGSVVDAMYWYFVSLIWIPMYATIYWLPRVL